VNQSPPKSISSLMFAPSVSTAPDGPSPATGPLPPGK